MRFKFKPVKSFKMDRKPQRLFFGFAAIFIVIISSIIFSLTGKANLIYSGITFLLIIKFNNSFWNKIFQFIIKRIPPDEIYFEGSYLARKIGLITHRIKLREIKEVVVTNYLGLPSFYRDTFKDMYQLEDKDEIVLFKCKHSQNPLMKFLVKYSMRWCLALQDPERFISGLKMRTSGINFKQELISTLPPAEVKKVSILKVRKTKLKGKIASRIVLLAIFLTLGLGIYYFPKIKPRVYRNMSAVYFIKGNMALNQENYKQAVNAYRKALKFNPKDANIYNQLSMAYMSLGQYEDALKALEEAIRFDSKLVEAYQNRAVIYRKMGRYKESIQACKQTIEVDPNFAKAYCSMGWALEEMGRYKKAINAHKQAIKKAPHFDFAHYRLGLSYFKAGKRELALEEYEYLKENNPTLAEALAGELFKEENDLSEDSNSMHDI
ncbi:MAG: tetratricopeptide repeat protein [Candidatus Omnitrophota bacterium]